MEEALGWAYASRRCYDFQMQVLKRAYDARAIREAEAQALRDAAAGIQEDPKGKQTIKAGKVIAFAENDPGGCTCFKALLQQKPIQGLMMNPLLKAEKLTTEFTSALAMSPASRHLQQADIEKFTAACSANLAVLDGTRGRQVVGRYIDLGTQFKASAWKTLKLSRPEQFKSMLKMLHVAGIAYRRLVRYFEQPKFQILGASQPNAGDDKAGSDGAYSNEFFMLSVFG